MNVISEKVEQFKSRIIHKIIKELVIVKCARREKMSRES